MSGAPDPGHRFPGEVTRLNCERQRKPFVYLNPAAFRPAREAKNPAFREGLDCWNSP
jgi:hypothetical protein